MNKIIKMVATSFVIAAVILSAQYTFHGMEAENIKKESAIWENRFSQKLETGQAYRLHDIVAVDWDYVVPIHGASYPNGSNQLLDAYKICDISPSWKSRFGNYDVPDTVTALVFIKNGETVLSPFFYSLSSAGDDQICWSRSKVIIRGVGKRNGYQLFQLSNANQGE